jgi:DNA-binding IclR family transcriptional regulator
MDLPSKIDAVLEFLSSDGSPHSIKDVATALNIPLDECETITKFLVRYDFAELEDTKLTIDPTTRAFVIATLKEPLLQTAPSR